MAAAGGRGLLAVALHHVAGAFLRAVGVEARPTAGVALAQEVPVAVELHAEVGQPRLLGLGEPLPDVRALQPVLLGHQLVDVAVDVAVVHASVTPVRSVGAARSRWPRLDPVAAARQGGSSITRALRVVEAVAVAGDGVTAKAIARRLGCPLPTVYRALGTLVEEGYLVRLHDVHGYGLGYRVAELHRSLTEQVRPEPALRTTLREVHTAAAAAAYLAVFRDVDVVVAHVDDCADHPRPDALRVGEPTPAHATAAGKVMLAGLRPARLSELLERTGLPRLAPRTVADRRALDRELMRIRSEGAAVEVEEYVPGVAGVAAPVLGADGEVTAALGVSVSRAEFTARRWELERVVRAAAARAVVG